MLIVVAPKKGTDDIRLCVDLLKLNRYVRRERYQSPTPAETVADIVASEAQVFTILDAEKGYHQCLMDEQSQLLTTILTPFGHFKYKWAPYGLSSIAEHYNRRMAEAFVKKDCPGSAEWWMISSFMTRMRLHTSTTYGSFYNGVKIDTSPSARRSAGLVADRSLLQGSSYLQRVPD